MKGKKIDIQKALIKGGLCAGGAVIAKTVDEKVLATMGQNMNGKLKAALFLGAGIFTPMFVKNDMLADVSAGIAAYGGLKLYDEFNAPPLVGYSPSAYNQVANLTEPMLPFNNQSYATRNVAGTNYATENVGYYPAHSYRN